MRPDPSWLPARTEEVLRRRPVRRLTEPLRERRFTYAHYDRFLARLVSRPDLRVVPLRELTVRLTEPVATIGLRHDVDDRLPSALRLAELEHARGLRATYFILPAIPRGEKLLAGVVALVTALVVLARVAILLGTWEGAPWSRSG